jgi:hypothetical protein
MNTIIQQFQEKIILDIKKEIENIFLEGISDISHLIITIDDNLKELGRELVKYVLEESDKMIKALPERKKSWVVHGNEKKTLITEFGAVEYERTYYKSKANKGFTYLVDEHFGIEKYQRIDKGLTALVYIKIQKNYG